MAIETKVQGSFYLVGAMLNPTEAERIQGAKKTVVVTPQFIVAADGEAARNATVLLVPRDITDMDRVEVFVALPFGR